MATSGQGAEHGGPIMDKIICRVIICGVLSSVLISSSVFADKVPPENTCSRPHRLYKFKTQAEVDEFKDKVENYRKCIDNFVEEQKREIQNHRDAANNAIEQYNIFIKTEASW